MTKQAGFKRRVRARMAKTGESYATARSRLLAEHPGRAPDDSPLDWMPEALHISNGDATDVPGTGLARRVIYWRDVLHEGSRIAELADLVSKGVFTLRIAELIPAANAAEAHRRLEAGGVRGRLVLTF